MRDAVSAHSLTEAGSGQFEVDNLPPFRRFDPRAVSSTSCPGLLQKSQFGTVVRKDNGGLLYSRNLASWPQHPQTRGYASPPVDHPIAFAPRSQPPNNQHGYFPPRHGAREGQRSCPATDLLTLDPPFWRCGGRADQDHDGHRDEQWRDERDPLRIRG
jgi:hypothetical protein